MISLRINWTNFMQIKKIGTKFVYLINWGSGAKLPKTAKSLQLYEKIWPHISHFYFLYFSSFLRPKQKTQRYFSFISFFFHWFWSNLLTSSGDFGVTTKLLCLWNMQTNLSITFISHNVETNGNLFVKLFCILVHLYFLHLFNGGGGIECTDIW